MGGKNENDTGHHQTTGTAFRRSRCSYSEIKGTGFQVLRVLKVLRPMLNEPRRGGQITGRWWSAKHETPAKSMMGATTPKGWQNGNSSLGYASHFNLQNLVYKNKVWWGASVSLLPKANHGAV